MTIEEGKQRAAAVCDNCGTIHPIRIKRDGEIRLIGSAKKSGCPCEDPNFRILSNDASALEKRDQKKP
jgi:hypothetical protein